MSNREKIIVILAFVAMLYGMYEYLFSAKPQIQSAKKEDTEDILLFISQISQELVMSGLTPFENYIIEKTENKWEDVFVPAPLPVLNNPAEKEVQKIKLPVYTGYMHTENRIIVIIDGNDYKEGDLLPGTGYKLIRISLKEIALQDDKREFDPIPIADEVESRYRISLKEMTGREENHMSPAEDKIKGFYENKRKN